MVNSPKYERNSKKELIGRLSRDISDDTEGTEESSDSAASAAPPSPDGPQEEQDPGTGSIDDQVMKNALPEVKDGRRMIPEKADKKSGKEKNRFGSFLPKLLSVIVIIAILIGAGVGLHRYIQSSSAEEEQAYVGVLPEVSYMTSTPTRSQTPSLVCRRVADISTEIGAGSYYAVFADSFSVAYAKDPHEKAPFASIVKLLGALIVTEEYDLGSSVSLKKEVDDEGNGIDLVVGEMVAVRDLLGAALIGSKNDAMYALAQNYPGGADAFVERMDEKASDIGMENTSVVNPIGLDDPDQFSTPHDIALLMIVAMRDPVIADLVSQPSYTVVTDDGREEIVYSTNILLSEVPGVIGGKTGYTAEAGLSLVTYVDDEPDFVTVVFNAEDRYEASKQLINAVREGYECK